MANLILPLAAVSLATMSLATVPLAAVLLATVNLLWYSVPLIVVVSLVYSATRHEALTPILSHAARLGLMIGGFMLAILIVLAFISSRL